MSAQEAVPTTVDLSKYIDKKYYGERPHIRGRRLLVSFIAASAQHNNLTIAELAYDYTITEEQVLAALLYYREHKAEIDAQDEEEQRLWDEMYRLYGEHEKK